MYFHYFVIISPWKRAGPLIWTNLKTLHQRMLCAKFDWIWLSGSGEKDFLISSMYFHYFIIISSWKRAGPFICTNLNPLHPGILSIKIGWNWPSSSGEEDFLKLSIYFYYFELAFSSGDLKKDFLNDCSSALTCKTIIFNAELLTGPQHFHTSFK